VYYWTKDKDGVDWFFERDLATRRGQLDNAIVANQRAWDSIKQDLENVRQQKNAAKFTESTTNDLQELQKLKETEAQLDKEERSLISDWKKARDEDVFLKAERNKCEQKGIDGPGC
jgi:hypothetical protein